LASSFGNSQTDKDAPAFATARDEERKDEMNWLRNRVLQLQVWKDTGGQDLVEYALAAGMVAVAAVACMPSLSSTVSNVFTKIGGIINNNVH
jgi:pilus assembly protein Flp/PilA